MSSSEIYSRTLYSLLIVCSMSSMASDFGTTGLIDIPTARMQKDGSIRTSIVAQSRTKSIAINYQATPWLEATFRYTGWKEVGYTYDRNYEVKVRLREESDYFPQLAVGIRDLFGTGNWESEYVVASKQFGDFDLTAGMGWGH